MNIVLHIFRKDVRRHWPEFAATIAIVALFFGYQPRLWADKPIELRLLGKLAGILPVLMILMWAFLIVRLVQGEALVGERQFWITRPYEWPKLLAAKLLSIILLVHVPLFLGQTILLYAAQFPVLSSISGLLAGHLTWAIAVVLPSLALGCLTRGIGQATLVLVAAMVTLLAVAWGAASLSSMAMSFDWSDNLQELIYLIAAVAVVLTQFAFRRTKLAWGIALGAACAIFLLIFLTPYNAMVSRAFPLPSKEHPLPVQFTRNPDMTFRHSGDPEEFGDTRTVQIPLELLALRDDTAIQVRGIKLDMNFDDGSHWSSGWKANYTSLIPSRTRFWPELQIQRTDFNANRNRRGAAHLSLALNVFRLGARTEIRMNGGKLGLPGGARCAYQSAHNSLRCFAALRQPAPMLITAELPSPSCRVQPRPAFQGWAESPAAYVTLVGDSSDPILSPVEEFEVSLSRYYALEDLEAPLPICAGTPMTLRQPDFVYSTRAEIDLGEMTLDAYHPTYPREIVPQVPKAPVRERRDTLSRNLGEPNFPANAGTAVE